MKFVSIFDTKDRGFTTRNYCEGIPPLNKNQITGDALKYMINFINWCSIEKGIKNESNKDNKCNKQI